MGTSGFINPRNNYGFAPAGAPSPVAEDERKWYMDQGFGDPNEVIGRNKAQLETFSGRTRMAPIPASAGKYKGVSPEARYLYQQSLAPKPAPVVAPVAAPAAGVSATLAVPPGSTRYAGKALTINPVSS